MFTIKGYMRNDVIAYMSDDNLTKLFRRFNRFINSSFADGRDGFDCYYIEIINNRLGSIVGYPYMVDVSKLMEEN